MAPNIIPAQFFLPINLVKLGRLITDIEYPHQCYYDPPAESPDPAHLSVNFTSQHGTSVDTAIAASLASLISVGLSTRARLNVDVTPAQCKAYYLPNSDDWFDNAVSNKNAKSWIERAARRGDNIYLIVGFKTLTDARLIQPPVGGRQAGASMFVSISSIAPLVKVVKHPANENHEQPDGVQSHFVAQGELVCALEYRKVRPRWFPSKSLDLSKTRQWPRVIGVRYGIDADGDGEEENEDAIEVGLEEVDKLDGDWVTKVSAGEALCIRRDTLV